MKKRTFLFLILLLVLSCSEEPGNFDIAASGGTTITAQVDPKDFLMAEVLYSNDTLFLQALSLQPAQNSGREFIRAFVARFGELSTDRKAGVFFNEQNPRGYPEAFGNEELIKKLLDRYNQTAQAFEVLLGKRLRAFGVQEFRVSVDSEGRLVIDLPSLTDTQRIVTVLRSSARLGFYEMTEKADAYTSLATVDEHLRSQDSTPGRPILSLLNADQVGAALGFVNIGDTAQFNQLLLQARKSGFIRSDLHFIWGFSADADRNNRTVSLYAVEARNFMRPVIDGHSIAQAHASRDPQSGQTTVDLSMTAEGSKKWADMTQENVGRPIAIVFEGKVLSAPTVISAITGGMTQISGNFTVAEATDLASFLSSSPLPVRLLVLESRTVSPK